MSWLAGLSLVAASGCIPGHGSATDHCPAIHTGTVTLVPLGSAYFASGRPKGSGVPDDAGIPDVHEREWVAPGCRADNGLDHASAVSSTVTLFEGLTVFSPFQTDISPDQDVTEYSLTAAAVANGAEAVSANGQFPTPPIPVVRVDGRRVSTSLDNGPGYADGLETAYIPCPSLPHVSRLTVTVNATSPSGTDFHISQVFDNSQGSCDFAS
jgi:hypothetical protein